MLNVSYQFIDYDPNPFLYKLVPIFDGRGARVQKSRNVILGVMTIIVCRESFCFQPNFIEAAFCSIHMKSGGDQ